VNSASIKANPLRTRSNVPFGESTEMRSSDRHMGKPRGRANNPKDKIGSVLDHSAGPKLREAPKALKVNENNHGEMKRATLQQVHQANKQRMPQCSRERDFVSSSIF